MYSQTHELLQVLQKQITTNPKIQQLKRIISNLKKSEKKQWISAGYLDTHVFQETKSQIKKNREASRRQDEMIACHYQNLFPYINDAIYEKWKI